MCGIAGIFAARGAPGPSRAELARMAGSLLHRGPDELGLYRDHRAGLAHARLSIIDLETGQQPLANEEATLWIAFNGEIFNYLEMRQDLLARGHRFRTRSDTEVIVHAYETWGDQAFERFNGQFSIALWDAASGRLVLARDRFGIHPLHLCEHAGRIYFASEVKAIFAADPSIPRAFDPAGLSETFTFWSAIPPRTVFAGVTELSPGCARTYSAEGFSERHFGAPAFPGDGSPAFSGSIGDAAAAVREALKAAVDLRILRADVPVGCYLSGGLDSSLVAALGHGVKGEKFRTFSIRFEDEEYDETSFQRRMVQHMDSDHREVVVSRRQIAESLPEVIEHAERPILRTAPVPLFLLSRLVREAGIKVVLTGEGADELFAGYDIFREAKIRRFWARQPDSACRPRLLTRLYPYLSRSPVATRAMAESFFGRDLESAGAPGFSHAPRWSSSAALQRLFSPGLRLANEGTDVVAELLASMPAHFAHWSALAQDQYLEIRTLLSPYLLSSQGDRMLMAHSVEGRFPYLDSEVAALANSLPAAYKLRALEEKRVLKRAADGLLPDAILRRKKQPYRAPDAASFVDEPAPAWIAEMTAESAVRDAGVFDARAVASLWKKCHARRAQGAFSNADNMALVGVLSTQLLHQIMIRRPPTAAGTQEWKTLIDRVDP